MIDAMTSSMVFSDIVAGYGDTMVLRGVSAEIRRGEVLGILGRNGVGKSTLMRALTGNIPLTRGDVTWKDASIARFPAHARRGLGISYAPQERLIFDALSVADNLTIGFADRSLARFDTALQSFPRIRERLQQQAGKLSGGEKKLLSFTRVISERSALTLIDEPSEGVQQENLERMAALIRQRTAEGASFVVVEQNITFLASIADHFLALDHGEPVLRASVGEVTKESLEAVLHV
ncbi:ABC transporter ATP-binding protein [Caballeronia sp. KNU42]